MRLPPYPKYRPSGVEWLGDIPEHWAPIRLKFVTDTVTSGVWGDDPNTENEGVPVATTANITRQGDLDVEGMSCRVLSSEEQRKGRCAPGDTIVVKSSGSATNVISGKAGYVEAKHGEVYFGNFTMRVRPRDQEANARFTWYFLISEVVQSQVRLMVSTTTYPNLQVPEYLSFLYPKAPLLEQGVIADFLDRETAKIDKLLAKKRTLIERLKEKRTTLISHTITCGLPPVAARAVGLNPHPKLKPSGIDWLGDVPERWETIALRRRASRLQTGTTPPTAEERYYEDGTIPWYGPGSFDDQIVLTKPVKMLHESAVRDGTARLFASGATLVVTIGATLGKVSSLGEASSCNQQITAIEFDPRRVHGRFATYQIKRLEVTLRAIAPSATLPILDQGEIGDVILALPEVKEQQFIADFLEHEMAKIDSMVAKVNVAIERLQEYRTALITAAVTGKIDVRGTVE